MSEWFARGWTDERVMDVTPERQAHAQQTVTKTLRKIRWARWWSDTGQWLGTPVAVGALVSVTSWALRLAAGSINPWGMAFDGALGIIWGYGVYWYGKRRARYGYGWGYDESRHKRRVKPRRRRWYGHTDHLGYRELKELLK